MRTKALTILALLVVSSASFAQFDFGGGSSGPSEPWKQFKLNPKTRMKLDFRNANVDMVISLFSKTSGITIVKDPTLTGGITLTSAAPLPIADAFEVLSATLKLKGFSLQKEGKLLVIKNNNQQGRGGRGGMDTGMGGSSGFPQMSPEDIQRMFGGSAQLKVYKITYANSSQVARVINEVFAQLQNPMDQMMQMMQQGGGNFGGQGGRTQGGRFGGGAPQGRFGGGNFGRGQATTVRASSDDFSNSVIVNAPEKEQRQVADLIKEIDKDTEQPLAPKVYKLEYAVASEIAAAVQNVLTSNAPRGRGGQTATNIPIEQRFQQAARFGSAQAAFGTVVADSRTNSLVVTATEDNHELITKVIDDLDVEIKLESTTFVFSLNNARADQIATLMNQAFGTRTGTNGQRTNQVGTRTPTTRNQNTGLGNNGGGIRNPQANSGLSDRELELALADPNADNGLLETSIGVQQGGGFNQFFGGQRQGQQQGQVVRDAQGRIIPARDLTNQITVIPDQNTNSLIIVASPDNMELIKQILSQLDRIPEQVMIETVIVEATLDQSNKLGVEWSFSQDKAFNNPNLSQNGGTGFGLQNANPALQGFKYTLTGPDYNVFLHALQQDQKFHVLSTPRIFTSNNSEAQINISQRVPYVLSSREDPNGNLSYTYAFEDVGIVLTVTPRITSNGYVTMEINQTANDLQGFTSFNAPIINQRQADTTVSVKDGETIILGGIIRSQVSSTTKKIPLLGDIPILGNLFKSTDKQNVKTELLVFLRPRVVRDEMEARRLREEEQKKLSKQTQESLNKNGTGSSAPATNPEKKPGG